MKYHRQFKRDYKLALKCGLKASKLEEVLEILNLVRTGSHSDLF
ncbi:type II toxin-antitoxin system YafQ family toxin [Streptococcus gallolyticus]|nr:type II toxin-antitoxin system YafQ family toxin [Streptococcus gallolyticus]